MRVAGAARGENRRSRGKTLVPENRDKLPLEHIFQVPVRTPLFWDLERTEIPVSTGKIFGKRLKLKVRTIL